MALSLERDEDPRRVLHPQTEPNRFTASIGPARARTQSEEEFWPAWDRELARQGQSLRAGPSVVEAPPVENPRFAQERDFQQRIRVQKYVKYFDRSVLNYNIEGIVGPGVFVSIFTKASVFGSWSLIRNVLIVVVASLLVGLGKKAWARTCGYGDIPKRPSSSSTQVTFILFVTSAKITEEDAAKLKSLVTDFHTLCTFLLSFFCSTSITRWWAMRNDCLGALWGSIDDISLIVGSYFPSDSAEDRAVRDRILRWSVLSHELVYKQARAETDLGDLVEAGLLLPEELELLKPLASKPQVIWAWMCSYFAHLAYGDPAAGGSRLPFPVTVLPQLHEICRHARGAVGMAFAYTDTQVPFRYVHFLSLIIWMHNFAQAVNSAVVFRTAYDERLPVSMFIEAAFLFVYPLVYFGLLHLGAGILNPLRAHKDVDFPQGAFTYAMLAENRAFYDGNTQPKGPPYGKPPTWKPGSMQSGRL